MFSAYQVKYAGVGSIVAVAFVIIAYAAGAGAVWSTYSEGGRDNVGKLSLAPQSSAVAPSRG